MLFKEKYAVEVSNTYNSHSRRMQQMVCDIITKTMIVFILTLFISISNYLLIPYGYFLRDGLICLYEN